MSMRSEPAMDYVSRAVWDILYADNACRVLRRTWGLAKMVEVMIEICRRPDNLLRIKKRQYACLHRVHRG